MDSGRNRASASLLAYQNLSELYNGLVGEVDTDHDCTATADYSCPFCGEDYDILGLCLHMDDEHPADAKAWVCPVTPCSKKSRGGYSWPYHHRACKLVQRRRRYHKGGSNSTISMLRKKFHESHIHSIYGGSSIKAHNAEPNPLLSSFISAVGKVIESQPLQSSETKFNYRIIGDESSERASKRRQIFEKEQEETARKSEFVQGLLLWTILIDE